MLILLISILIIGTIVINVTGVTGINKTVGWAWDLRGFIIPLSVIYVSTYLTLYILKIKTNSVFSILSVGLLLVCYKINSLVFILFLTSLLIFLSNCMYSIYLKYKK